MAVSSDTERRLRNSLKSQSASDEIVDLLNAEEEQTHGVVPVMANTSITTAGDGTLTAAGMGAQLITRSGPTADYTDTTATAAQLYAQMPTFVANMSFLLYIKNTVAYSQTVTGGTGVTVSGVSVIPALSVGVFLVTLSSSSAATVVGLGNHLLSALPETKTVSVSTGTGTLSAGDMEGALMVFLSLSGQAAITLTSRTAAQIIAGVPNWSIGGSYFFRVINGNTGALTLAGGTGVTLSSTVPQGCYADFVIKYTAAATVVASRLQVGRISALPVGKFTTDATGTQTADAGDLTGAQFTIWKNTANGAVALTTRTATQMFGDIPNAYAGMTFLLRVISAGDNTVTVTAGTGVTITGTATVDTAKHRDFLATFTSATALTLQDIGAGTT